MSVERLPNGRGWRTRWRDSNGKPKSKSFQRKADADHKDREVKRAKALGPHMLRELEREDVTLAQYVNGDFRSYANTLVPSTRRHYDWALSNHLRELADEPLRALDVPRVARHQRWLLDHGRTPNTVRAAMTKLSGILQVAAEDGLINANPVRSLRKHPLPRKPAIVPFDPWQAEALLEGFTGRSRVIVALGWHLGLRPKEIRLVSWDGFHGDTFTIRAEQTKKGAARDRTIAVPADTARILRAWRLESGGRDDDPIVGPLSDEAQRQWGLLHLKPAAKALGRDEPTVIYTLRHSHASALHYAGFTIAEASQRMGHDPQTHLKHYAHVVAGISGRRYAGLDELIAEARAELACQQRVTNRA